jgi:signal transduction histidine kinase
MEGLVQQIAIPLLANAEPLGVLEMWWCGIRKTDDSSVLPRHDEDGLRMLATYLVVAMQTSLLEADRRAVQERALHAQRALSGIGQNLRESVHSLAKGLTAVGHSIDLLLISNLSPELKEIVKPAQNRIHDLNSLFKRVMDAGVRLANDQHVRLRVDHLLHESLAPLRASAQMRNITLFEDIEPVEAKIDGVQMLECFSNLIENAIKASPQGSEVLIRCRKMDEQWWEMTVQDHGPGFDPAELQRFLSGALIERKTDRQGIGLFLTRLYVESHGGRLLIESTPGSGATVRLRVPLGDSLAMTWDRY